MSEVLRFMMGEYEARFPADLHYARNHMWARQVEGGWRFGFAMYAVRLLQDVYFLEWNVDASTPLKARQEIGFIESKKAESDLFSPIAGTLTTFNEELLADPSGINIDNYGAGWLFEIEGPGDELLTAPAYIEHLASVWEVTQRTIKGQMNE